jgi:hypothetical protein
MQTTAPRFLTVCTLVVVLVCFMLPMKSRGASQASVSELARGKSLVAFGACNDCHTPGWRESDGTIPTAKWMTGSGTGFRGRGERSTRQTCGNASLWSTKASGSRWSERVAANHR